MAPHATDTAVDTFDKLDIKAKVVGKNVEIEAHPLPPVADDFMYAFKYNAPLPTTDVLGIAVPNDCVPQRAADEMVARLSEVCATGHAAAFADLFLESGKL